ncbi:transporter substrate-binding domain-containing protein [Siculibacillus lacustris]|uniref:Transporter substrate-binding domain-containing protein n=1 Tax=Siculibacillus lacustris TaxID=1549641 RepID=A0A4Q9VT92_9HYPH|nr:transporter substrate-binding domain-containing protein [Siculibacillus lacustris]TBW39296.1 transporter substrate-binding domain-containing protein [Siculibacillus lacustris]
MIASFAVSVSRKAVRAMAVAMLTAAASAGAVAAETGTTPPPAVVRPADSAGAVPPAFWDRKNRVPKPTADVGAIRFLTSGDFPPFAFLDSEGRLIGFHVELARSICEVLEATCTLQMRPFGDLVAALGDKRGDAIIAGLKVTPELRPKLDTSDAYLTTPGRFVVRVGATATATPEGLAGRWISVVSGSAHEAFVLATFPAARVAAYPDETAARDALRDGRVEAHFGDALSLSFWLSGTASRGCCDFRGAAWTESGYFGEGLRIAVAKGNRRLKQSVDYALQKLGEDGRLTELYQRWFPRGYY